MLIFTKTVTPRLQYIADFIGLYYKSNVNLTSEPDEFCAYTGIRINYSLSRISDKEHCIVPVELLYENTISEVAIIPYTHSNGYTAFFETREGKFDLFAGVFYLLSRYEEYLSHQKDIYGRYSHKESLAYKEGFLHQPLINVWLEDLRKSLAHTFPELQLTPPSFKFIPTYDIDIAWSYKSKGFVRNSGGFARSLLRGQWGNVKDRVSVLAKRKTDPFDSYDWMNEVHKKFKLEPIYFFHVGHQRNSFDKNISISNVEFQQLIRGIACRYSVALHPSWHSGDEPSLLKKELKFLSDLIEKKVTRSRQHYIRLTLPGTYQQLVAAGITEDYTMGYATVNGFRASIASPFYWYNLEKEEATGLLLYPFCYMDANSFFEQKLTPEEAVKEMLLYHSQVKDVNGTFITIWHNPFLGKDKLFAGWKEKYHEGLETILAS